MQEEKRNKVSFNKLTKKINITLIKRWLTTDNKWGWGLRVTVLYHSVLLATEKDVLSYQIEMNPPDRIPTSGVRKVKARKRNKNNQQLTHCRALWTRWNVGTNKITTNSNVCFSLVLQGEKNVCLKCKSMSPSLPALVDHTIHQVSTTNAVHLRIMYEVTSVNFMLLFLSSSCRCM